jgi:hypothetical protein
MPVIGVGSWNDFLPFEMNIEEIHRGIMMTARRTADAQAVWSQL